MTNRIWVQLVILCGGSGARLWPLSRAGFPKQFLCLKGGDSLLQQAANRLMDLGADHIQVADPLVVTGEDHRLLAVEQLREIGVAPNSVLLEPVAKNTAPALTLAALAAVEHGDNPVLVVTPADQTVADASVFNGATHDAIRQAAEGAIVILGVPPTAPKRATGTSRLLLRPRPPWWLSVLSKNPMKPLPDSTWQRAVISGTPACLCSRRPSGYRPSKAFGPILRPPLVSSGPIAAKMWRSCDQIRPNLPPYPVLRSRKCAEKWSLMTPKRSNAKHFLSSMATKFR